MASDAPRLRSSISLDEFVKTLDPNRTDIEMFAPSLHIETVDNAYGRQGTLLWLPM